LALSVSAKNSTDLAYVLMQVHPVYTCNDRRTLGITGIGEERNIPDICCHALVRELA
jgi:hypothetical protein